MSSGFVSGGTIDQPLERDDEWRKAQQEIEERRRQKEEERRQGPEKSLYEVLQNNKAAKEEAFQESIKLKNQFRNLDEDEVEFLDSVLESTRAKEQAVKKETSEQLEVFRRQQEEADKGLLDENGKGTDGATSPIEKPGESQWAVNARKRKRLKDEKGLKGPKLRKSSSAGEAAQSKPTVSVSTEVDKGNTKKERSTGFEGTPTRSPKPTTALNTITSTAKAPIENKPIPLAKPGGLTGLGLADYSSDDD